jgi:uncharacterized protein (DUF2062 family)
VVFTRRHRDQVKTKVVDFIKFRVLHVDDSPHRIALGFALGILVAFMPPLGFHMLLVAMFAFMFKANKFVALSAVWISNPFTFLFIYYPNYIVGSAVLGPFGLGHTSEVTDASVIFNETLSFGNFITSFYTPQFWSSLASFIVQTGFAMFIGGLLIGGMFALAAYLATVRFITWYRLHHPHNLQ